MRSWPGSLRCRSFWERPRRHARNGRSSMLPNFSQNILTAARELQQIQNEVTFVAERGADADQPGPQPDQPALFGIAATDSDDSAYAAAAQPGARHRLQRCEHPESVPEPISDWLHWLDVLGAAHRASPNALAEHVVWLPGCVEDAGHSGWQFEYGADAGERAGVVEPRRQRARCRPPRQAISCSPWFPSSLPTSSHC